MRGGGRGRCWGQEVDERGSVGEGGKGVTRAGSGKRQGRVGFQQCGGRGGLCACVQLTGKKEQKGALGAANGG